MSTLRHRRHSRDGFVKRVPHGAQPDVAMTQDVTQALEGGNQDRRVARHELSGLGSTINAQQVGVKVFH